jgi:small subunit ribosomal protein S9
MDTLNALLFASQQSLRQSHIFPLPSHLIPPQPPQIRWKSTIEMAPFFGRNLKNNTHRRVTDLLNELNKLKYIAELGARGDVAQSIQSGIEKFLKAGFVEKGQGAAASKPEERVDEYGRALGLGKRKTASASVWIIPTKTAAGLFEETTSIQAEEAEGSKTPFIAGEILVNHVPLSTYFRRPLEREIVLRPLRLAGYLGAYNVFAKVQGGGPSGQCGAVALGLARALLVMRGEEVRDILMAGELEVECSGRC